MLTRQVVFFTSIFYKELNILKNLTKTFSFFLQSNFYCSSYFKLLFAKKNSVVNILKNCCFLSSVFLVQLLPLLRRRPQPRPHPQPAELPQVHQRRLRRPPILRPPIRTTEGPETEATSRREKILSEKWIWNNEQPRNFF